MLSFAFDHKVIQLNLFAERLLGNDLIHKS